MADLNSTIVRGNLRVTDDIGTSGSIAAVSYTENGTPISSKYLALSGGTITGPLSTASIYNSGSINAIGGLYENSVALSNKYLQLSGGTMTGNISYKGTNSTSTIIKFKDNTFDAYGNGIAIGGGGIVIIGAGESSDLAFGSAGDESLYLAADSEVKLYSNAQDGLSSAKVATFNTSGVFNAPSLSENGTSLSSKYLGISATAADSSKLGGVAASSYATKTYVDNAIAAAITTALNTAV